MNGIYYPGNMQIGNDGLERGGHQKLSKKLIRRRIVKNIFWHIFLAFLGAKVLNKNERNGLGTRG
jgi:hypothetical protein